MPGPEDQTKIETDRRQGERRQYREAPPARSVTPYEREHDRGQVESRFRAYTIQRFDQLRHDIGGLSISHSQRHGEVDRRLRGISGWQQVILAAILINMAATFFLRR